MQSGKLKEQEGLELDAIYVALLYFEDTLLVYQAKEQI
jgi:hypothetical protein